jgi:hypothetical protein
MPTKVQKKVLWWIIDNGGELYIMSGHKRVLFDYTSTFGKPNEMFCRGNDNLIGGLEANVYAERMFKITEVNQNLTQAERFLFHRFKITEKGIKAAGKNRPDPSEHSNVPHRNKRYK